MENLTDKAVNWHEATNYTASLPTTTNRSDLNYNLPTELILTNTCMKITN